MLSRPQDFLGSGSWRAMKPFPFLMGPTVVGPRRRDQDHRYLHKSTALQMASGMAGALNVADPMKLTAPSGGSAAPDLGAQQTTGRVPAVIRGPGLLHIHLEVTVYCNRRLRNVHSSSISPPSLFDHMTDEHWLEPRAVARSPTRAWLKTLRTGHQHGHDLSSE